jgi:hypothetical protein
MDLAVPLCLFVHNGESLLAQLRHRSMVCVTLRQDTDGTPLVHFKFIHHVEVTPAAVGIPELDLLLTLGWYLMYIEGRTG